MKKNREKLSKVRGLERIEKNKFNNEMVEEVEGKDKKDVLRPQLMGSGTILREVLKAAEMLKRDYAITSDVWSVTSFNELRREALEKDRWNQLHVGSK